MSTSFDIKKRSVLSQLNIPDHQYTDASPKGSVDEGIRELVDTINADPGYVTTSSCSGRIAVFVEGSPKAARSDVSTSQHDSDEIDSVRRISGVTSGGKGGGRWLFISHDPIKTTQFDQRNDIVKLLGLPSSEATCFPQADERPKYIHFKFEPMTHVHYREQILHILSSSVAEAQHALTAAMTAGFRESGISCIFDKRGTATNPMVAVRSAGLAIDSIIGFQTQENGADQISVMVSEDYLRTLIAVANERFTINAERIARFRTALLKGKGCTMESGMDDNAQETSTYEPSDQRKARKRREGLLRRDALHATAGTGDHAGTGDQSIPLIADARQDADSNDNVGLDLPLLDFR